MRTRSQNRQNGTNRQNRQNGQSRSSRQSRPGSPARSSSQSRPSGQSRPSVQNARKEQNPIVRFFIDFADYFKSLEAVDYKLIISIIFLMMFGLIVLYSATAAKSGYYYLTRQLGIGGAGFILMLVISYVDYHQYTKWAMGIFGVSLLSVFLVLIPGVGQSANGANRWISIFGINFQPSELLKPAIIILMTFMLMEVGRKMSSLKGFATMMVPVAAAVLLVLKVTSNLSTAVIILGIAVIMLFVAYPNKKIWAIILGAVAVVVVLGALYYRLEIADMVKSGTFESSDNYRVNRVLAWLYPEEFPDTARQSLVALYGIGFGGFFGRGLGSGTAKYYLSEVQNDFIFSAIAEELGFLGCAVIIFLFIYQIWRIFTVAAHARDKMGAYMALGFGTHVALQVILHIGVVTSVLPNTGVSLPYISYGGTALLILLCEMGIVLNISRQIPGKKIRIKGSEGHGSQETTTQERKTA